MALKLGLAGCVLLFLGIWGVTVTMPTTLLLRYCPADVQEKLRPRAENMPMSLKRVIGWIILFLMIAGYIGLFVYAGIDGKRNGIRYRP